MGYILGFIDKIDFSAVSSVISAIGTVVSAYFVKLTYNVYKKSLDVKLYPVSVVKFDHDNKWDSRYLLKHREKLNEINFGSQGFPTSKFLHDEQKWDLFIYNNGDLAATNIVIKYKIVIYKHEIKYGVDSADVTNANLVVATFYETEERLDYLAPNTKYQVPLIYLEGKFPQAKLEILELKCNENIIIKEPICIYTYEHPGANELADSPDYRKFVGTIWEKERDDKTQIS